MFHPLKLWFLSESKTTSLNISPLENNNNSVNHFLINYHPFPIHGLLTQSCAELARVRLMLICLRDASPSRRVFM